MCHTIVLIQWFKFVDPKTNILIAVNREIRAAYTDLKNEGVDVKAYKTPPMGSDIEVSIEEIDEETAEAEETTYDLVVNLVNSDISFKRFNQIIEGWGFKTLIDIEDDDCWID
jgi:hypothetical protein